jgi:hypothetical protein
MSRIDLMTRRSWRRAYGSEPPKTIAAMGHVNVVFHVDVTETATTFANRVVFGLSSASPTVNGRPVITEDDLRLVSNTNHGSAFVHTCIRCYGQRGKILRFKKYLIRIGRYSPAQAYLNVIRYIMFVNSRPIGSIRVPNMVVSGVFKGDVDRKIMLETEPRAVQSTKFPGITIELRDNPQYGTPSIHTRNPAKFNIAGPRSSMELAKVTQELDDIMSRHNRIRRKRRLADKKKRKRKNVDEVSV